MPRPTENDPNYCETSHDPSTYRSENGWLRHEPCNRVLKQVGAHRVRSATTQTMDRLRDSLVLYGVRPSGGGVTE
jgi:hypothetical protein